jgi:uncharacterized repeat protein (TIGR03803 family)
MVHVIRAFTLLYLAAPMLALAQPTLNPLYSFTALSGAGSTNADGAVPTGGLVVAEGNVYGTALVGGAYGQGTVFVVNVNGLGFTNLHDFTGGDDGAQPLTGLVLSGNTLYGTTRQGGSASNGKLFAINTGGSNFTPVYSFSASTFNPINFTSTNTDGAGPMGDLIVSGSTLYGTANGGGKYGQGTVFAINTNHLGFTNLHSFALVSGSSGTNSEGANPFGALLLAGDRLYGTTYHGGNSGNGTIFAVKTDSTGFTNLHNFAGGANEGAHPEAGLVLVDNMLYGTTAFGGSGGNGTLFAINTNGTGFTNLHNFTLLSQGTNSDGAMPKCALAGSGNMLYGTATGGGINGNGTVFSLSIGSTQFTTVYSFSPVDPINFTTNSDGVAPFAGLFLSGDAFYGTAQNGGGSGDGTVFALILAALPPSLAIALVETNALISWPASASDYTLQTATNLTSGIWSNITSGIGVLGTNSVFTNLATRSAAYFRLQK